MDNIINEIFSQHEVRKSKKQKTAFIEYAVKKAEEQGYSVKTEKGAFGTRNIVVGDPDNAKVVYTAHYDTCARLPFPNFLTPKNFGIYLLYNLAIVLGFFVVVFALGFLVGFVGVFLKIDNSVAVLISELLYLGLLLLLFAGPANKHTANDNTSGVTVLFGIMKALPEDQRDKAAFVFFDYEEAGLVGSSVFAGKHKEVKNNTLLLNFDCVSDGRDIMILTRKDAEPYSELLSGAFVSNEDVQVDVTNKAFYPSDQARFKRGVGVAAFNRTKGGMLYINKIHTSKDTVYRRENIDFLVDGAVKLTELV